VWHTAGGRAPPGAPLQLRSVSGRSASLGGNCRVRHSGPAAVPHHDGHGGMTQAPHHSVAAGSRCRSCTTLTLPEAEPMFNHAFNGGQARPGQARPGQVGVYFTFFILNYF
jgi:hypothetical protein